MSARPMSEARRQHIHGPIVPMDAPRPRIAPPRPQLANLLTLAALAWLAVGLAAWWLA